MKGRVLVVGFATRHVVRSAARAGYEVCAVDHFCDQDLCWNTKDREKFLDIADLPHAVERICGRQTFDLLCVTSGAEDLSTHLTLCGTPKEKIGRFLDKRETQVFFEQLKVPVPRLLEDGKYPAMIKPRRGAGGWRNTIIRDKKDLTAWQDLYPATPFLRQEIIEGIPASVCCITDGSHALAIAVNEQFLRGTDGSAFGFSGSVTPLDHPLVPEMIRQAEHISVSSGCTGTIGIDFVLDRDTPYAIEVNPRFQGTLDTVEMACGCNLFQYHVDACNGILPAVTPVPKQVAVRSILFCDRDITITEDLKHLSDRIADIPWPGTFFEEGQALVSVFGWGKTRQAAFSLLDKHISTVRQYIR